MTSERLTFGHRAFVAVPPWGRPASPSALEPPPVRLTHPETWDWGWGGLLIFTFLLFFRPQDQIVALGRAHVSDAAALLGLAAMVVVNLRRHQAPIRITAEVVALILLGGVILLGVPFSIWPGGSLNVMTTLFLQVSLIFLLMVNTVTSPARVDRIGWVIVLAFGYVSARVCFDYLRGVNLVEGHRAAGPVGGFFENPNDLALNLAAFMPLAMMYARRPFSSWAVRLLCAAIAALMLLALVFTKSRSGLVGALAMFAVYAYATRLLRPSFLIAGLLAGLLVLPVLPASFTSRMSSIVNPDLDTTGSREERVILLERAWLVFLEHPLTGIGAGQFKNYGRPDEDQRWREAHNVLLQVASETGVFGLALFAYLIARMFGAAWWTRRTLGWIHRRRHRRQSPVDEQADGLTARERFLLEAQGATLLACAAGWFAAALFASVAFNWTFYYLLGLAVAARNVVRQRRLAYSRATSTALTPTVAA